MYITCVCLFPGTWSQDWTYKSIDQLVSNKNLHIEMGQAPIPQTIGWFTPEASLVYRFDNPMLNHIPATVLDRSSYNDWAGCGFSKAQWWCLILRSIRTPYICIFIYTNKNLQERQPTSIYIYMYIYRFWRSQSLKLRQNTDSTQTKTFELNWFNGIQKHLESEVIRAHI